MARSLQADVIVARLGDQLVDRVLETARSLDEAGTAEITPEHRRALLAQVDADPAPVILDRSGYLERIDFAHMVACAAQCDGVVHLLVRPADFQIAGEAIAHVAAPRRQQAQTLAQGVAGACALGLQRRVTQHAHFEVAALVEVALRALSPGINDPYTARTCIDRLTDGLARVLECGHLAEGLCDRHGILRVVRPADDFAYYLRAAMGPLRQAGMSHDLVVRGLIQAHRRLLGFAATVDQRTALAASLTRLRADIITRGGNASDRHDPAEELDQVARACGV